MQFLRLKSILVFLGVLIISSAHPAQAQLDFGNFKVVPELDKFNTGASDPELKISARIRMQPGATVGLLEITASTNKQWHIYSLTQPAGGPMKSTIKLDPSDQYRLLGSFAPDHPPYVHYIDVFKMDAEEFSGEVTWSAPIEILGDANNLKIGGFVEGQTCADGGACVPFDEDTARFEATVTGSLSSDETTTLTGRRLQRTHSPIRTWLSTAEAKPGDTVQMHVAFNPDPEWHVYAYAESPPSMFQKPTLVRASLPNGWTMGAAKSAAPIISEEGLPNDPPIRYYAGAATVTVPITIPSDASPGKYVIPGHVAYQTCAKQCDPPTAIQWQAELTVASEPNPDAGLGIVALTSEPADYDAVAKGNVVGKTTPNTAPKATTTAAKTTGVASLSNIDYGAKENTASIQAVLGAAFLGGFILNFMPCVLPVIGLKILAFVDQAGSDRIKIFNLNLWYAFGMLSVFWVLAALAAAPAMGWAQNGLGWGEQFSYQGFAIPMIAIVFVMALSFLGVWEIPIPGFATGAKADELTQKDGYSGAFFKGVITTLLATPCSAPGLGAAYAFAVNSKSAAMPFLIFTVMGIGMAIPYLIIGAFPSLIRLLPKPGAWMDTFKQLMGFVLLGTVIFLMQNVDFPNLLPTLGLLFGLWFACWWIGSVPMTAERDRRMRAWGITAAIAILSVVVSFGRDFDVGDRTISGLLGVSAHKYKKEMVTVLNNPALVDPSFETIVGNPDGTAGGATKLVSHDENSLPWELFSTKQLDEMIRANHTVLVDFTADW